MGSTRRRPLLVPALLCVLVFFVARPSMAGGGARGGPGGDSGAGARVTRLYEDASAVERQYEEGRRQAVALRAEADRAARTRARAGQGRVAAGGGPAGAARPTRGRREVSRTESGDGTEAPASARGDSGLAAEEARARSRWRAAERRNAVLAGARRTVLARLEEARSALEAEAEASVAAGSCRGAVRLGRPAAGHRAGWVAPVGTYRVSAGFGEGGGHWAHRHTGQDFAVPVGTPVRAVGAGRVVRVSCGGAFGIAVEVEHPDGDRTRYAHLADVTVERGRRVAAGEWIGQSGTTGNSTGPHLHFEVRTGARPGSAVDPVPWLARHGIAVR
ncbi:M23 family metallopeptidase [Streptomyces sp. NPDC001083]|uniref:M23 family metallopeptidase n=1 Tax=Streptomyces sp. NPDC001083 TaxID=3364545 RepID=UPI0036C0CD60